MCVVAVCGGVAGSGSVVWGSLCISKINLNLHGIYAYQIKGFFSVFLLEQE